LPNRILLHDRLQQVKAFAHRMNNRFALIFLDLDRFKIINDTLGHAIGDDLLKLIAGRLKDSLRETDTVARIGGDEFIVLLVDVADKNDVRTFADKLLRELDAPFLVGPHELFVTTSAGICIYPDDDEDIDMMMQKADIAMYQAKEKGRNNYQFYKPDMDQHTSRRFIIAHGLRKGLDSNQFRLYYQPKQDVVTGRIIAMEALIRWLHPELGMLSPTEFIQTAEESGLIMELGEWVLREACRQNSLWHSMGLTGLRMAVNLSGYQLQHHNLIPLIKSVLEETGMPGDCLEFEITESVIMQHPDYVVSVLNEITALGIHISIDDFGTGYSSLSHLKRFTVNTLKIDKAFVRDVEKSTTDAAIASAIISMGSSLKLKVIAEGVETQEQMDFFRDNNCDQVQGFLISKPVPPEEALMLLLKNWAIGD
jgi:diguanylate cyclase (GGDEF)-like protein